jgi:hypothetical protein
VLVVNPLPRYVASAIPKIRPGHAETLSGTDFLLSEMKEYDA